MNKADKAQQIAEIKDRNAKMTSLILTNFKGIDVEKMTALRDKFREAGVDYKVVKNTLFNLAIDETEYKNDVEKFLKEPTAVAWSYDDPSAAAKVIMDFCKTNKNLQVKCGVLGEEVLDVNGVEQLSKMPGKDELLATLLATFNEPATGMLRLFQAAPLNFVYLLDARKRQLEE
jgi:large subunit ribosomal protein L10